MANSQEQKFRFFGCFSLAACSKRTWVGLARFGDFLQFLRKSLFFTSTWELAGPVQTAMLKTSSIAKKIKIAKVHKGPHQVSSAAGSAGALERPTATRLATPALLPWHE